jgi:hypothetical protein
MEKINNLKSAFLQEMGIAAESVEITGQYVFFKSKGNKYSGILTKGKLKKGSLHKEY